MKDKKYQKKEVYIWDLPGDEDLLAIAKVITKYLRFLDPEIIRLIVKDTQKYAPRWRAALDAQGINSNLYLWEGSPCCFPGIRRYRKTQEKAWYLRTEPPPPSFPDALKLDFNDYPKELYTYLLRDNLHQIRSQYSLIHILSHGDITNQVWLNLPQADCFLDKGIYGLFTSPANTIYAPSGMINAINTNPKLKSLLAERVHRLYRQVCSIVPPEIQLRTQRAERGGDWHLDRFDWAPCVSAGSALKDFLAYRYDAMEALLQGSPSSLD